jgi:hydrogenase-4 membrane subunit HyfE
MKPKTRDNLIYLGVGLSIVSLVCIDLFYADSHGQKMWWPSKFALRTVTTPSLLAYFVVKEMRREKATLLQTFAAVLFATLLQLGIMFSIRQIIDQLPGMSYSALAGLEMFVVWQLSVRGVFYLTSSHRAH